MKLGNIVPGYGNTENKKIEVGLSQGNHDSYA
jgi:hypothetical protein